MNAGVLAFGHVPVVDLDVTGVSGGPHEEHARQHLGGVLVHQKHVGRPVPAALARDPARVAPGVDFIRRIPQPGARSQVV